MGELPDTVRNEAALYAGCIAGAQQKEEYLSVIREAGFINVTVQKERRIEIPNVLLARYMSLEELREFKRKQVGIFSITVYADKP
jgi:arsenite methyltransferase